MLVALRVLAAYTLDRRSPEERDVEFLRHAARSDERDLPLDELACVIIKRERGRLRQKATTP
jgi:hypothetical protein